MPRERPKRTDDELLAVSRHLLYEIEMLAHTASWLYTITVRADDPDPKIRSTLRNAMLESWALHVRNLLSFIYDDRPGKGAAIAADFVDDDWQQLRGDPPPVLRLARAKASKEIAHLLYGRAELSDEQRTWHLAPILVELSKVLHRFLQSVPDARLQTDFRKRAFAALPEAGVKNVATRSQRGVEFDDLLSRVQEVDRERLDPIRIAHARLAAPVPRSL
jgi:hypothetical protein